MAGLQKSHCHETKTPHLVSFLVKKSRSVVEVLRMSNSQYLRNLVESMPRRLEDVISREENPTKY